MLLVDFDPDVDAAIVQSDRQQPPNRGTSAGKTDWLYEYDRAGSSKGNDLDKKALDKVLALCGLSTGVG